MLGEVFVGVCVLPKGAVAGPRDPLLKDVLFPDVPKASTPGPKCSSMPNRPISANKTAPMVETPDVSLHAPADALSFSYHPQITLCGRG